MGYDFPVYKDVDNVAGLCQVERKYAPRLKVADYRNVILGPQKRASRPITPTRSFPSNAPILPQLDNARAAADKNWTAATKGA
jgi:hypothetical protein